MITFNDNLSYKIYENGYSIFLNGNLWIEQKDQYAKPYDARLSYEENCLMQLEDLTRPVEEPVNEIEQRISDIEDALIELASMME